ncbi:hypothetical protein F4804DRAFT_339163 [Jackrogersella minutella]|nr:hypothetical protein F4804DRAFT_339163 [Jackrogersella minutella]
MYSYVCFAIILNLLLGSAAADLKLNVTAVGVRDGRSTIECWQFDNPFTSTTVLNRTGDIFSSSLGGLANLSYTFVPPKYDQGIHTAPFKQWVILIKGLGLITVPGEDTQAYVTPGETGVVFAADTPDVSSTGHRSQYLGVTETIILQIPTRDNSVPPHEVLYSGSCNTSATSGLWDLAMNLSSGK